MKPVEPPEDMGGVPIVFAKDQPEYLQLPARTDGDTVVTVWELTAAERVAILAGAPIVLQMKTFGRAINPIIPYVRGVEDEAGRSE